MNLLFITSPQSSDTQRGPYNLKYHTEIILQQTLLWEVTKHLCMSINLKNKMICSIMVILFLFLVFQILFPLIQTTLVNIRDKENLQSIVLMCYVSISKDLNFECCLFDNG